MVLRNNETKHRGVQSLDGLSTGVCAALQQQTAGVKAAIASSVVQWSPSPKKSECVWWGAGFIKSLVVLRLRVCAALQQQTADFEAALHGSVMQWGVLTEKKHKGLTFANTKHFG